MGCDDSLKRMRRDYDDGFRDGWGGRPWPTRNPLYPTSYRLGREAGEQAKLKDKKLRGLDD